MTRTIGLLGSSAPDYDGEVHAPDQAEYLYSDV